MRIGAYQFCVTGDIDNNYERIEYAVKEAVRENVRLLVFPECALTGYPPRDFSGLSKIDFEKLKVIFDKLQELSNLYHMYIFVGTVSKAEKSFYNTSMIFSPFKERQEYHKRALWGGGRKSRIGYRRASGRVTIICIWPQTLREYSACCLYTLP